MLGRNQADVENDTQVSPARLASAKSPAKSSRLPRGLRIS
jgi:hypothetical protein